MELKGLKAVFLGDSITEGYRASTFDNAYWQVLARRTGLVAKGYGVAASRIARQAPSDPPQPYDEDFVLRAMRMDADADIVCVFGGTNDFGHGTAPIGTPRDRDPYTFYGAVNNLFRTLIERYPNSFIFVMTPLHRTHEEEASFNTKNPDSRPLIEYKLEDEGTLQALLTGLCIAGSLVGSCLEVPVTQTTTTTFEKHYLLAVSRNLANNLACLGVARNRTEGHLDNLVLGALTRHTRTATRLTILGEDVARIFKVDEGPILAVASEDNATTRAAVATIGTTVGHKFLPAEVGTTRATRTRAAKYLYVIYKVRHSRNSL